MEVLFIGGESIEKVSQHKDISYRPQKWLLYDWSSIYGIVSG